MSLQFIFGNSGSGKSSYLYRNILKEAAEHPEKNNLVLVPEQFTMQTQRELVRLEKSHAIMNVDVLSFARLAYRVFDELGKQNLRVLEETGKNLVLRKLAGEQKKNLSVLGGNLNRMGYISEVKSLISELTQYNVSPEKLDTFLETEDVGETLRLKMQDISVMYHSFSEYLQGQYITSEEVLSLLCDAAEDSNIIKDSVIVFDEFTGFTPIQNQLLRKLLVLSERIIVSVTMDAGEDFYHCRGEQELFSNESFYPEVIKKYVPKLKLRASVGRAGNDNTGGTRFLYRPTYKMDAGGFTQGYNDTGGGLNGIGNGIIEGRFAAPYLGWEVEDKQNYGFDIGLFDNRLEVIFDYFDSTRSQILLQRQTVPQLGGLRDDPWQNFGKVRNRGVDMSVNAHQNIGKVKLSARGTFTFTRNKILEYDELPPKYDYQAITGKRVSDKDNLYYIAEWAPSPAV